MTSAGRLPATVLYHGTQEPPPERILLRAGPLTMEYVSGDLRYLRLGGREVLRRLYVAVRDRNWSTVPATLENLEIDARSDSFDITCDAVHERGEISFAWRSAISGSPDGTLAWTMDGAARSTFLRNRIGFCALHPIRECAGQPCVVEHTDGSVEHGEFPLAISPHQPFMDMRAISHEAAPGVRAELRFAGDVFEMEDQRNWTDASYKTYSTPIALPYPVEVPKGERISQSVSLRLHGDAVAIAHVEPDAAVTLTVGTEPAGPLPRIGLGLASHGRPLSEIEIERLRLLRLSHLHVPLDFSRPGWEDDLRRAAVEVGALRDRGSESPEYHLVLVISDRAEAELDALATVIREIEPLGVRWILVGQSGRPTRPVWVALARERLQEYDFLALFGGGTDASFVHLNRNRPPTDALSFLSYSINPQVHAFDDLSLVETLEAQAATVESARRFAGGLPVAVGPVTLRPRFNPDATGPEPEPAPGELPPQVDPRQMSLLGAAWTLGSLASLAGGGVESVTYYETSGWRGVMERPEGSPLPARFHSIPGGVFPLYHVLADAGEVAGGAVLPVASSDPLRAAGLAIRREGRTRVLLANLSAEPQRVTLRGVAGRASARRLDETNAERAMVSPEEYRAAPGEPLDARDGELTLDLLPYAVVRLDEEE